jgi:hypothetical protein
MVNNNTFGISIGSLAISKMKKKSGVPKVKIRTLGPVAGMVMVAAVLFRKIEELLLL